MTNQNVNKSENVVQVAGNVTVNNQIGLAVSEVRELVAIFMRENMPVLREEAIKIAHENAAVFVASFEEKLTAAGHLVDPERFKDPDVQSSLNDAVLEAAKKGSRANIDLLNELLIERVSAKTSEFVSMVAAEAIKVVSRLTPAQIAFLTIVQFFRAMSVHSAESLADVEPLGEIILELSRPGFGISDAQKSHLQSVGCVSILPMFTNTPERILKAKYGFLSDKSEEEVRNLIDDFPALRELADAFSRENVAHVSLTTIGQIVALSNLSRHVPNIEYGDWLS